MSIAAKVVAVLLGLAIVGAVGFGLAVANGWGPYATEVAFGSDEVLTADDAIVLDSTLDLTGPAVEPCPAVSMPIPAAYSDAVTSHEPVADLPDSAGQTTVRLSPTSWMLVVCLGDADQVGTPEQIVQRHRTDADFAGSFPVQLRPVRVTAPFGEAVRWSGSFAADGSGTWLTDWYVEHDGTVLAVGYLRQATDPDRTTLVESMLAGLTWSS